MSEQGETGAALPIMSTILPLSKKYGISYEALRRMCLRGEIVHIRVGRKILINVDKLDEYLNGGCMKCQS